MRTHSIIISLLVFSILLTACGPLDNAIQRIIPEKPQYELIPTPPTPTSEPAPYIGQVGQHVAFNGWSIQVDQVIRSSLDPTEDEPEYSVVKARDYIAMDVTVERTAEGSDYIYGDLFTLQDSDGNIFKQDPFLNTWDFAKGTYTPGITRSGRVVIPVPRSAQDFTLYFAPSSDIPEPLGVALDEIKIPKKISLREAIDLGLITADVRGVSLENIVVDVSLESEDSFEITLEPGTAFLAPSPDLQTMIVREGFSFFIEEKNELSLNVEVACANMRLEAPGGGEVYIVQLEPPAEELRKLLGLPEFQDSSFRLQQFAIWTITDKPARGGYVGLGTGGAGSPPSSEELKTIATWFDKAGLSLADYPALP